MHKEPIIIYTTNIERIAQLITNGKITEAAEEARQMPERLKPETLEDASYNSNLSKRNNARNYNDKDKMQVFIKDGFIDRYTGHKLVLPAALRLISEFIPDEFPFHKNWAKGKCHDAYWELSATVDHIRPVANDGTDDIANLVSTSMAKNLQKNSISLEDLGWELFNPGKMTNWDGLCAFFLKQCDIDPGRLKKSYYASWYRAVKATLEIRR